MMDLELADEEATSDVCIDVFEISSVEAYVRDGAKEKRMMREKTAKRIIMKV